MLDLDGRRGAVAAQSESTDDVLAPRVPDKACLTSRCGLGTWRNASKIDLTVFWPNFLVNVRAKRAESSVGDFVFTCCALMGFLKFVPIILPDHHGTGGTHFTAKYSPVCFNRGELGQGDWYARSKSKMKLSSDPSRSTHA